MFSRHRILGIYKYNFFFLLLCLYPWALISGPFFSDLITTILCIYIIFKNISEKKIKKFTNIYFILFILFFIYLFLNSFFIGKDLISIKSSVFYFRFGFFALAVAYILKINKDKLPFFFFNIFLAFLLLVLDSIFQKIFGINLIGIELNHPIRVSSFFGEELILGSYVVKILPILLAFLFFLNIKNKNTYSLILIFLSIFPIILSAEKTAAASLIIFLIIFLILFDTKNDSFKMFGETPFKRKLFFIFLTFFLLFSLISFNKGLQDRLVFKAISNSINGKYIYSQVHDAHFKTAFKMFLDRPIFGHGPKMFRIKCSNKKYIVNEYSCSTHPHNFYLQILAETGIIGFFFLSLFYISLLIVFTKSFVHYFLMKKNYLPQIFMTSSLLITFLPIATSGNIFNNWISCLNYFSIGILLFFLKEHEKKN